MLRRRCDHCGKMAQAIGDDGARALGWLVGATAMCDTCAGPPICVRPPGTNWKCEDCNCDFAGQGEIQTCDSGLAEGMCRYYCRTCKTHGQPHVDGYSARVELSEHNAMAHA